MLLPANTAHQTNLFGTDLLQQLDEGDPLLQLAAIIPWSEFEQAFAKHYTPGARLSHKKFTCKSITSKEVIESANLSIAALKFFGYDFRISSIASPRNNAIT